MIRVSDSDILIDFLRFKVADRAGFVRALLTGALVVTIISKFELLSGARSNAERSQIAALFEMATLLPLDDSAVEHAAALDLELRSRGIRIATGDTLIAGIALSRGLALVTRNRRHFDRVPGLSIEEL